MHKDESKIPMAKMNEVCFKIMTYFEEIGATESEVMVYMSALIGIMLAKSETREDLAINLANYFGTFQKTFIANIGLISNESKITFTEKETK